MPPEAPRIALVYCALFFSMGIHLPYWPVWLVAREMTAEQVGILLGTALWARAVINPFVGRWIDRGASSPLVLRGLTAASALVFVGFAFANGFWALLVLSLLSGLAFAPIMPLIDGLAIAAASARRLDYGRVRSWGSAAFIVASLFGGMMLEGRPEMLILWTLLASGVALFASTFLLPPVPPRPARTGPRPSLREVLRRPGVMTLMIATATLQAGHAVLYGFGTAWWREIGIDDMTIGALWAEGVLAEVGLFAIGARLTARFGAPGLLVIAGIGGLVRWPALAAATSLPALFAIQTLHAATFAAMHLGAMSWIRDNLGEDSIHRATALYTAVAGGIALGIGLPVAGILFERFRGDAYVFMAIAAGVGLLAALRLARIRAVPA